MCRVQAKHGVVVAAGVWSGRLLADATGQAAWQQLLQPRRGHLLELLPPPGMPPIHTGRLHIAGLPYRLNTEQQQYVASFGVESIGCMIFVLAWFTEQHSVSTPLQDIDAWLAFYAIYHAFMLQGHTIYFQVCHS